jgi:hypothetical protein
MDDVLCNVSSIMWIDDALSVIVNCMHNGNSRMVSRGTHTALLNYTASIVTVGDAISKVDKTYVNRTTLRPMLDLSASRVSRPCLHIPGLANSSLVYCVAHTLLVPTPYVNFDMSSPQSSWPTS